MMVRFKRLPHARGLPLPAYETPGAAGMDLRCAVLQDEVMTIEPGHRVLVPTGLCMELPPGHEGQVRPRSGLSVKHGITVINAPGTIDEDYRGEIMVPLVNLGEAAFSVSRGMRIAQLVIAPVVQMTIGESDELSESERGERGFGSTGMEE